MNDQFQSEKKLITACGGTIHDPNQYPSAFYQGNQVFFCTNGCLRAFEEAPDDFMKGEIEHPIGED